jgi:hypothetical protein
VTASDDPLAITYVDPRLFASSLKKLSKNRAMATYLAISELLAKEGKALVATDWLRYIESDIWEFRIGKTTSSIYSRAGISKPPGHVHETLLVRVFCSFQGESLVLLITAYDKGADASSKRQQAEIAKARSLLVDWKANH